MAKAQLINGQLSMTMAVVITIGNESESVVSVPSSAVAMWPVVVLIAPDPSYSSRSNESFQVTPVGKEAAPVFKDTVTGSESGSLVRSSSS